METMETLTKADLAKHVMENLDMGKKEADQLVKAFLDCIVEHLRSSVDDKAKVELRGFGSFRLRNRQARQGRNPRTGQSIAVPPRRVVYFKLGKELRSKLIEGDENGKIRSLVRQKG